MATNQDFRDLFSIFGDEGVEFLVVGAHAVAFHAEPRYTKDLDILIRPSPENARRAWRALGRFGAPLAGMEVEDLTRTDLVYQIGIAPNRIDILMGIGGVSFEEAWAGRVASTYGGVPIWVIGRQELIASKRATDRPQDRLDLEKLE